ncbi:MAG: AAA family ATPase, partial [Patescibacteria group bacterium]
ELSGFKSFAKNTVLEFPTAISAVVGPNGSGKSNVADAIRWVLGEQSIKTLRGKRGEDMIFSGSSTSPRMNKASVVLAFDNSKKEFPLEFDEVGLGRRVYRDGQNEYLLNDSQVRLRDIIELLARVGFGSSQHHIIGQGEADRILYASPRERREMIEDALGLKIFQLKRLEAERKLQRTEENIRDVERLRKEIQPHLKFLKAQAEKYEFAAKIRDELKEILTEYIARMAATLKARFKKIQGERREPLALLRGAEKEISRMKEKLEVEGSEEARLEKGESKLEEKLGSIREARAAIEREAGRLEGILSLEEKRTGEGREAAIPRKEVEHALTDILSRIDKIRLGAAHGIEGVLHTIRELHEHVAAFLRKIKGKKEGSEGELEEYRKKLKKLKSELEELKQEETTVSRELASERGEGREEMEILRAEAKELYEREREAGRT